MKKFFLLVPTLMLSALFLTGVAFAAEGDPNPHADAETQLPEGETPPEGEVEKVITGIRFDTENVGKVIKLGEMPTLTDAVIEITYFDGSTESLPYDENYFVSFPADKKGRVPLTIMVKDQPIVEYFTVYDPSINVLDFKDVTKSYWGYRQIQRTTRAGFFVGISKDMFGVADGMTRAQFCQMIYHIYGDDPAVFTCDKEVTFSDVAEGTWYYTAVNACAQSDIVSGMGDGTFGPDNYITRQDVSVIMMSVLRSEEELDAQDIKATVSAARKSGIKASDFDTASEYAKKYLAAALGVIYYGDNEGKLNPHSNITRSECAAMCSSLFFKGFVDESDAKVVYLSPESDKSKVYAIWDKNDPDTHQYTEHIQMTIVAEKVKALLEKKGYEVHIADPDLSIKKDGENRALEAAALGADAYVALHSNAAPKANDGSVQGTNCFYNGKNEGAKELSDFIYERLSDLTPTKDRGSLDDMLTQVPFAEIRLPTMANVLIEVEFHDYAKYAQWIVDNTDAIAEAVALGIDEYLQTLD